ncbi:metal-dependent hydrolase [Halalkalicoccus sp. NIPERK01]|uniref:metal-dependent hydrolase n=1 Tax=Halalkalicoccus sp. NIPERK01 TaxID=3053469 RepID=UPI00256F4970|nr:metal-dependent hydrolase [Halalkalicoccus sp. NIPERK01]MDL5362022.1 metal-dependent hydrolase [Halalkalicoccus sp. NIPERK01]
MATTHALVGMALALPAAYAVPELAPVVLVAGLVGGLFPDLDLYVGHRKTLHYPVYYPIAAGLALVWALLSPGTLTVALATFLLGAAVHSVMDAFGGGLEMRPWLETADRAVYDHYRGRWIAPKRGVRYDGAPEDLLLAVSAALPMVVLLDGPLSELVVVLVAVSAGYALVRKQLVRITMWIVSRLPTRIRTRLPSRYHET